MAKKKKWIQAMVKGSHFHKGKFTAWCKSQGFPGVTDACIAKGLKSKDPTVRKEANLAKTFKKMRRNKHGH